MLLKWGKKKKPTWKTELTERTQFQLYITFPLDTIRPTLITSNLEKIRQLKRLDPMKIRVKDCKVEE